MGTGQKSTGDTLAQSDSLVQNDPLALCDTSARINNLAWSDSIARCYIYAHNLICKFFNALITLATLSISL